MPNLEKTAKAHAKDISEQAKSAATHEASARADDAIDQAAQKVQQAADAADAAASQFDPASPQAQAVAQVADRIEDIAAHLRTADLGDLADQATGIARRHPALFVGGAALAGFAAARFLKARAPQQPSTTAGDPWASQTAEDHTPTGDQAPTGGPCYD